MSFSRPEDPLSYPAGICFDNEGNIVIADRNKNRIQIFEPEGKFLRGFGGMVQPQGVLVDQLGNIFVAGNGKVQVFTPQGFLIRVITGLYDPWGLVFAHDQSLLATNYDGRISVFAFGSDQKLRDIQIPSVESTYIWGLDLNSKSQIVVADNRGNCIRVLDFDGKLLQTIGSAEDGFRKPLFLVTDGDDNIAVGQEAINRITIFNSQGDVVTSFGEDGPLMFTRPVGIALDQKGNLFITDQHNHRVQVWG